MNLNASKVYCLFIPVDEWSGETLDMTRISRLDMGAYLCIATNGVPPTVSKQIKVSVDCEYLIHSKLKTIGRISILRMIIAYQIITAFISTRCFCR